VRAKTPAEKAFCALGPVAEDFITAAVTHGVTTLAAVAHGVTTLAADLTELVTMAAAHDAGAFVAALARATEFGRFRAADVRSILAAGAGVPGPRGPGDALVVDLPTVSVVAVTNKRVGQQLFRAG
jgi:hypothetical protein